MYANKPIWSLYLVVQIVSYLGKLQTSLLFTVSNDVRLPHANYSSRAGKSNVELRGSNKQSRIFRLNDVIMAGISVQIANNTNYLNNRNTVLWIMEIHKYFENF